MNAETDFKAGEHTPGNMAESVRCALEIVSEMKLSAPEYMSEQLVRTSAFLKFVQMGLAKMVFADEVDSEDSNQVSEDSLLGLSPDDLEGLPPELLQQLNITDTDKFESFIVKAIKLAGGVMTLDKLLIAWWRESGEVIKRQQFNAKLYRMTRKKLLWAVPNKKGIYTTDREIGEGKKSIF